MPITFTPLGPSPAAIGWGMFFDLTSDFIGPFPAGTVWFIKFTADAEGNNIVASQTLPATTNTRRIELDVRNGGVTFGNYAIPIGQNVHVITQIIQPGNVVVDSGAATVPWVQSSDDYRALLLQIPAAGTGLTASQSTQLEEAHDAVVLVPTLSDLLNTLQESVKVVVTGAAGAIESTVGALFSGNLLDTLTLTELTSGPTGDPVSEAVTGGYFAIIVRITTTPPNLQLGTPAQDYSRPDLAVLRVFRGEDVFLRRGIHETDYVVYPLPFAYGGLPLSALLVGLPPDLTVDVQWAFGVEGQVFLMKFP